MYYPVTNSPISEGQRSVVIFDFSTGQDKQRIRVVDREANFGVVDSLGSSVVRHIELRTGIDATGEPAWTELAHSAHSHLVICLREEIVAIMGGDRCLVKTAQ